MKRLAVVLGIVGMIASFTVPASAAFVWGNGACWATGTIVTASGNFPANSISRTHSHTTSAAGGVFADGSLISNIAGTVCSYTLAVAGSTFTINAFGVGTSTINWTASVSNPAACGPSFTGHGSFITQAEGSVGVSTDPGGTFVTKCSPQ